MKKNIHPTTNQESLLKLDIGEKLHLFCNHNIYKVTISTENNLKIAMPTKNYFFVGDQLYIPYNNYLDDNYLNIPLEYLYIKLDDTQHMYNKNPEQPYQLVMCDKNGEKYHYNYSQFYIPLENIINKSEEINLKDYYNIQKQRGNGPLFKIVPEVQHKDTAITSAVILDLYSNKEFAKLSSESLQYKQYYAPGYEVFTFSYSDSRKHQINDDGSISLHNIRHDIIHKEMENNPIFLIIQNGNYFFTDEIKKVNLVENYNTALRVLEFANFQINEQPDYNNHINMEEQFIFKVTKSSLHTINNKNYASIILNNHEIPLIPKDNNTYLFFDGDNYFEYCNNVSQVFKDDAPISGFTKDFYNIAQQKLDSNNIHISIKLNEKNNTQICFSDIKGNNILDLTNTQLTGYLSTIFPSYNHQDNTYNSSAEDTINQEISEKLNNETQKHNMLDSEKSNLILQQPTNKDSENNSTKLIQDKNNITNHHTEQNTEVVYFPLSRENVNIGDSIGDNKYHISFKLTYEEMSNFYKYIQENYSNNHVYSAYNSIIKNYDKQQNDNENTYIDQNNHVFINNYDFGILQ